MLRGIARYARLHGPWGLNVTAEVHKQVVPRMNQGDVKGGIGRVSDERIARAVMESGVATLAICLSEDQLHPDHAFSKLSAVIFDAAGGVAKLAVEHFLQRGFRNFAYVGFDNVTWSQRREKAFFCSLAKLGASPLFTANQSVCVTVLWRLSYHCL